MQHLMFTLLGKREGASGKKGDGQKEQKEIQRDK